MMQSAAPRLRFSLLIVLLTLWFWVTPIFINEEQIPEARTVGHDEGADGGALEAVTEQRLEAPNHQERGGEEQSKVSPRAGEAESLDGFGERIHARSATQPRA
jgi:hypothetical protein